MYFCNNVNRKSNRKTNSFDWYAGRFGGPFPVQLASYDDWTKTSKDSSWLIILAMVDPKAPVWLMRLSAQPNLFAGDIPYVPVLLEEIDEYTRSADFKDDCIKTIETIGILRPVNSRLALLVSLPGRPKRKLRLALENFDSDYLHPKNPNGHAAELRDAWKVVRVFGILGTRNKKIVLEVEIFERVEDPESASKLLKLLSGMARRRLSMYVYEVRSDPHLESNEETSGRSEQEAAETKVVDRGSPSKWPRLIPPH